MITLSGVAFGHHDPQTLLHMSPYCGFSQSEGLQQYPKEIWRTLNVTM